VGAELLAHELAHALDPRVTPGVVALKGPVKAPSSKPAFDKLKDGETYESPDEPDNPVLITRNGNTLTVSYRGTMAGRPAKTFPRDPKQNVSNITFGGKGNYLTLTFSGKTKEILDVDSLYVAVERTGLVTEQYVTNFAQLQLGMPAETVNDYPAGLTVASTEKEVTYTARGAKTAVRYDIATKAVVVYDAADPKRVLLDSRKDGFKHVRGIELDTSGKGTLVLGDAKQTRAFALDLSASFDAKTASATTVDAKELARHDKLLKELAGSGITVVEEGRQFSNDSLAKIVALLAALKPETRKKLAKSKVELKKTLRLRPSESKRLGNSPVVGGQTSSPVVEDTATIHEFVHELFDNAGISTDEYSAKDLDDKAKALRPQVDELEKRDPNLSELGALRSLSKDTALNSLWLGMFDALDSGKLPGFTAPAGARVIDLADEGNYGLGGPQDEAGHPFDNVNEYVASFVTLATLKQADFVAAVKAATAGKKPVKDHFQKTWDRLSALQVAALGKNPF
jgi:hypothetical protein